MDHESMNFLSKVRQLFSYQEMQLWLKMLGVVAMVQLLITSGSLYAQTEVVVEDTAAFEPVGRTSRLNIGLRGGGVISYVLEPNDQLTANTNPRLVQVFGYTGGLSVQYYSKPNFSLQFGVNYAEKGWEENYVVETNVGPRVTDSLFFRQQINYLDFPVMAHGYVGNGAFRVYLEAGFFLTYVFSHSTEQRLGDDNTITYQYVDGRDNTFGVGVNGGAGFEIATAIGMFQLGGRYNLTFTSPIDKNITPIPNPLIMNSIKITLGYFIMFR